MADANDNKGLAVRQPAEVMTATDAQRFMDLAKMNLPPDQREFALMLMQRTGLSPLFGEIIVYENKLYITKDGWSKLLNGSGTFDGMPFAPRYLGKDEREARGYTHPDDIVVEIALKRKGSAFPVYGVGRANKNDTHRGKQMVEKLFPQVMAETRAFRRAARLGFQDVIDGFQLPQQAFMDDEYADVDRTTGEIIEGRSRVVLVSNNSTDDAPDLPDFNAYAPQVPGESGELFDSADLEEANRIVRNITALAGFIESGGHSDDGVRNWIKASNNGMNFAKLTPDVQDAILAKLTAGRRSGGAS